MYVNQSHWTFKTLVFLSFQESGSELKRLLGYRITQGSLGIHHNEGISVKQTRSIEIKSGELLSFVLFSKGA